MSEEEKNEETAAGTEEKNSEQSIKIDDIKSGHAKTVFTERLYDDIDETDVVARGKFFAVISYIWILCLVPVFFKKQNRFAAFHARQGLLLLIWYVAAATIKYTFGKIWLLSSVLAPVGCCLSGISMLCIFFLSVFGIYQAATGSYWRLPMALGDWAEELEVPRE